MKLLKMNKKKISIGTAQFLDGYGLKKNEKLNTKKISEIFDVCESNGIHKIDTAIIYGEAEKILGKFNLTKWEITSKLNQVPPYVKVENFIRLQVEKSLKNLKIDYLDTLLLHSPNQLYSSIGNQIYDCLNQLIIDRKILKFGYSVYSPEEFIKLHKSFKCKVCQIPFNVFDQRIFNKEFIQLIENDSINLQIRSIFLQGILLLSKNELDKFFNPWEKHFTKYYNHLFTNKIKSLDLCYKCKFEE